MNVRDAGLQFEAVKVSIRHDKNGVNLVMAVHPNEVPPDLFMAPVGSRWMIVAVQLTDSDEPATPVDKQEAERAVMAAGALCRNRKFMEFLVSEGHILDGDGEEEAAAALRSILDIKSRSELRTNHPARRAFDALRADFDLWMRK